MNRSRSTHLTIRSIADWLLPFLLIGTLLFAGSQVAEFRDQASSTRNCR